MLNQKSFLAVDFGAGSLKLAEFEVHEAGGLRLTQFRIEPLGQEGAQENTREAAILKALQKILGEKNFKGKSLNVCAPGFHVFSKFVKLPPVETSKVTQIVQYEAQQNVPFPLAEVVWDYQIMGQSAAGELEVLLVAIKKDIVEGLFRVSETAGLKLQVCDVSPAALCNAFRYNYGDLDECVMLLDIGAKTSNLLFFEKGKVYSRSINIGANSITQDFVNESKLKWDEAERIKIEEGFVSLGGAYEEPENPRQAAVAKIARQFMTRLHIQVNQTMQFYRGQQGGSQPQRMFLSGGASVMAYTAQFFSEKLNVPVEYFNPLRNIQLAPAMNLEELARVAHSMGELVGLGLRNLAHCPVELNLMPESTLKWQSFNEKKPYLMASVFSLTLVVFAVGWLFGKLADVRKDELVSKVNPLKEPLERKTASFKTAYGELSKLQKDSEQLTLWMQDRFYWADVLAELRRVLMKVEVLTKSKFGTDAGVWVDNLSSVTPSGAGGASLIPGDPGAGASPTGPGGPSGPGDGMSEQMRRRYGIVGTRIGEGAAPAPTAPPPDAAPPAEGAAPAVGPDGLPVPATPADPNAISAFNLTCRAVSLQPVAANANTEIAFTLLNELKASTLFDPDKTRFPGNISADEPPGTYTFVVTVHLKRPLKL